MQIPIDQFGVMGPDPINGRWSKMIPGYFKLNVDESFRDGRSTYTGVLRDHQGMWLWLFTGVALLHSALEAEAHALLMGLKLLLQRQIFCAMVESDSSTVIYLLHGYTNPLHPLADLVDDCKHLHRLLWSSPITWVAHSCNLLADGLARLGHSFGEFPCFVCFDAYPPQLEELCL